MSIFISILHDPEKMIKKSVSEYIVAQPYGCLALRRPGYEAIMAADLDSKIAYMHRNLRDDRYLSD